MRRVAFTVMTVLGCAHQGVTLRPPVTAPHAAVLWNVRASVFPRALLETDNEVLLLGDRGERWLVPKPLPKTIDAIIGVPAATLLPPSVVGAVRRAGAIVFVLRNGARLRATTPLGDATEIAAPSAMHVLVVTDKETIAIKDGALVRSIDDGATWLATKHPPIEGFPWSGAIGPDGHGLVSIGKQFLATADRGISWGEIDPPPGGWRSISLRNGQLSAGSWVLGSGDTWQQVPPTDLCCEAVHVAGAPFGPDNTEADRVDRGYAALSERYVFDMKFPYDSTATENEVDIERRAFGGNQVQVVAKANCDDASIAVLGSTVEYLCVRGDRGRLLRSEDDGTTWLDDGVVRVATDSDPVHEAGSKGGASVRDHRIHLGADRALMISTACPESDECSLPGLVRRAGSAVFEQVHVNYLSPRFGAVKFVGKRVFAVGTVAGDGRRVGAIFESNDGGLTFDHYTVRLQEPVPIHGWYLPDRGEVVIDGHGNFVCAVVVEGEMRWGAFARVGEKWEALATRGIPSFAWPRAYTDQAESNDGGRTWQRVTGTGGRARCVAAGCLVGSNDRIGWALVAAD